MVHEDSTHRLGSNRIEVTMVLTIQSRLSKKAQVGFMHKSSRLQRVSGSFETQMSRGNASHFGVDEVHQLPLSLRISAAQIAEDACDVSPVRLHRRAHS